MVAGAPNVGKSQLVRALSSGKPRVASYPFTTQKISVGHLVRDNVPIQVVDTPGILDRPADERNPIEQKAISALTHLADIIVYLLDPSQTCGYDLQGQNNILSSIKELFTDHDIIEVETKSDLKRSDTGRIRISALNGDGVPELLKILTEPGLNNK